VYKYKNVPEYPWPDLKIYLFRQNIRRTITQKTEKEDNIRVSETTKG
jgi:hypothetical protein